MLGFVKFEYVNEIDDESRNSFVDEVRKNSCARFLRIADETKTESLDVFAIVRRVKKKKKPSFKLNEKKATSKPTEFQLVKTFEKKSQISLKQLKKVSKKDSAFAASSLELRIVFLTLQESDQLAQQRRSLVASSTQ